MVIKNQDNSANPHSFAPQRALACGLRLAVLCGLSLILGASNNAQAQDAWHLTAYRVYAPVIFEPGPAMTESVRSRLMRDLSEQCDNVLGAIWDLEVATADSRWQLAAASADHEADRDELIRLVLELQSERSAAGIVDPIDKVFLIRVSRPVEGWRLVIQELDVATRILGHVYVKDVAQSEVLSHEAFHTILQAFAPLARIEDSDDTDDVRIGLRAGGLPVRDANLRFTTPGDLFVPVIRQNNRDGTPRGIRAVPWTYLQVKVPEPEEPAEGEDGQPVVAAQPPTEETLEDSPILTTEVFTALQSAFSKRRRGREEKYALAVHVPYSETTFRAMDRNDATHALSGYEVISYTPDSPITTRLGTTNALGELTIRKNASPLHLLLVRSGSRMLARLPIVPGSEQVAQIELVNDRERLEMEGYITGIQEEMVGVFTQREVLIRLINTKLDDKEVEEAQELMEKLQQLPTARSFRSRLSGRRSGFFTGDQYAAIHINKMFDDTERVLDRFFTTAPISELQRRLENAAPGTN